VAVDVVVGVFIVDGAGATVNHLLAAVLATFSALIHFVAASAIILL